MGNALPVTLPPKPSSSRAVIFMESECIRTYLRGGCRRPIPRLQVIGSTDGVPPALDGAVPAEEYLAMASALADRAARFRGGRIQIAVVIFQACLLMGLLLWLLLSRCVGCGWSFFNPITLGIFGALEVGVLSQSGRYFQREEKKLKTELLELCLSWRREYGIIAKVRKTRGQVLVDGEKKVSTYYCLVLEKMGPNDDADTVSVSTFADVGSEP